MEAEISGTSSVDFSGQWLHPYVGKMALSYKMFNQVTSLNPSQIGSDKSEAIWRLIGGLCKMS